jgi:hypothetical protein
MAADLVFPLLATLLSGIRYQATPKDLPAFDPGGDVDGVAGLALPRFLLPTLVRQVTAVVPGVLGQDLAEVPRAADQL